jgi:hypothetical protein
MEDKGGEGDAVGDLQDRRDNSRKGVSPEDGQISVARALSRQVGEQGHGGIANFQRPRAMMAEAKRCEKGQNDWSKA